MIENLKLALIWFVIPMALYFAVIFTVLWFAGRRKLDVRVADNEYDSTDPIRELRRRGGA